MSRPTRPAPPPPPPSRLPTPVPFPATPPVISAEQRQRVHSELARLRGELEHLRREQSSQDIEEAVPTIEPVDFANALAERENRLALIANLESLVQMGELAVERLANGRYGLCERCHRPIAPARLEALPFATDCIECAAARR